MRTQSRPPVAWIWGGIALMIVVIVAAMVWVFSLAPERIVGEGTAITVPDVVGEEAQAAIDELTELGLRPSRVDRPSEDVDAGLVVSTSIEAGEKVSPGEGIEVVVSSGRPTVTLPSLTNMNEADAIAKIQELGLNYGTTTRDYSPNVAQDLVTGVLIGTNQSQVTGQTQVDADATINLIVSNGLVNVPDQRGQPITAAQSMLQGLQLTVKLSPDNSCTGQGVTGQSGMGEMPQRSTITLVFCNG